MNVWQRKEKCVRKEKQLHLWPVHLATWNKENQKPKTKLNKQKTQQSKQQRWPLKVTLWNFMQLLCCLLGNFIFCFPVYMVWNQRCDQRCSSSAALRFLWALGGANSKLQADGHLGLNPRDGSGNGGLRLVWGVKILLQDCGRECLRKSLTFLVKGVSELELLSSWSHGKSLPALAMTKTTERKTEMRDRWEQTNLEASTSLGLPK